MAYKMKAGKEGPMRKNFPSAFKKKGDPTDKELEAMVNVNLPEVKVTAKADGMKLENPTDTELADAKRQRRESSSGTSASMKTNLTTGKREMVSVISNKKKFDARQAAEEKVFNYNKANKNKPGYVRQTFKKNISKENKYIS